MLFRSGGKPIHDVPRSWIEEYPHSFRAADNFFFRNTHSVFGVAVPPDNGPILAHDAGRDEAEGKMSLEKAAESRVLQLPGERHHRGFLHH